MPDWINEAMPFRGPCGLCGSPDASHRVLDAMQERVWAGDSVEGISEDYGYPIPFVERVASEWNYDHAISTEVTPMSTESVINEIAEERRRQIEVEGFDAEHDRHHAGNGALAYAAGCYAEAELWGSVAPRLWPWEPDWWKPKDRRRNLICSAALALAHRDAIVAEIERLDRAAEEKA